MSSARREPEALFAAVLAAAGVGTRLIWISVFPTRPVSDFRGLIAFAEAFLVSPLAPGAGWGQWNSGFPMLLALVFRVFPGEHASVAREATAILLGLTPLLPYLLWRRFVSLRIRLAAGLFLALWPGLVFFSGVAAQDNWVVAPSVALLALAVRCEKSGETHPFASAALLALSAAIRQEMLFALAPAAFVAAGLHRRLRRGLRLAQFGALTALFLLLMAGQRFAATGRFSLTTGGNGISFLGTTVPGAGAGWVSPVAYFRSIDPHFDGAALRRNAFEIALRRISRRPVFHIARIIGGSFAPFVDTDGGNLGWSIGFAAVLPEALRPAGQHVSSALQRPLQGLDFLLLAAALGGTILAACRRVTAALVVGSAVAIKFALHVLLASQQARYNVPVFAWLGLFLPLVAEGCQPSFGSREAARSLAAGFALALGGTAASVAAVHYVRSNDEQIAYRFELRAPQGAGLDCRLGSGFEEDHDGSSSLIRFFDRDPFPEEAIEADCRLTARRPVEAFLSVAAGLAGPRRPGKMELSVLVGGREVFRRDLGDGRGLASDVVALGIAGRGEPERVAVRVQAVGADSGFHWGDKAGAVLSLQTPLEGQ